MTRRDDKPAMDFLDRQNDMSFLKARKSNNIYNK